MGEAHFTATSVAQNENPVSTLLATYANVLGGAFSVGPTGQRRAIAAFAWELFDNEVRLSLERIRASR